MGKILPISKFTSKIGSGATPKGGKKAYLGGKYALIRSQNVHDFIFSYDGLVYINDEQAKGLDNVEVKKGDVLLNITGDSIARCCSVPENILPARVNQHVSIIRCNNKEDSEYLKYYLINMKPYLMQICGVGGTRNALTKEVILKLPITFQNNHSKLANILSFLDLKIELNNKINKELEAMAKTLYDYWFVQFDFPDENGKPYKSSGGKMVYNEDLKREIPKIWNIISLDSIIDILNGYAFKSEDYVENGTFVLRTKNFNENSITEFLSDDVYLPNNFQEKYNSYLCQPFDYHLVMVGASVGKTGMIYSHQLPALRNQNMWCFRPKKKSSISRGYLKYLVDSLVLEFSNHATGSARQFYTKDNFKNHSIILPSDDTLKKFENLHKPILNKQANIQKQNQELSKIRDWLLPMLMNGQVKVKGDSLQDNFKKDLKVAQPKSEYN